MARPLTPRCDQLLPWLQAKEIVVKSKVAKPCNWGFSQLAYCRKGPGVVVYIAKRFHLDGVLQELKF